MIILALASMSSGSGAGQTQAAKEISPAAKAYLQAALDLIQANSVRKKSVDWNLVRRVRLERGERSLT